MTYKFVTVVWLREGFIKLEDESRPNPVFSDLPTSRKQGANRKVAEVVPGPACS